MGYRRLEVSITAVETVFERHGAWFTAKHTFVSDADREPR